MAGCQDDEYSYDASFNGRPNGAFTYVALYTLSMLDENATYKTWMNAIRQYLPNTYYPQTPNLACAAYQRKWKVLSE